MFDLQQLASTLPASNKPLRIVVRQLHWFWAAFEANARACGEAMGCNLIIDEQKLANVFVRGLNAIETQRPQSAKEREEFFDFVPSLVLRELIADLPLSAASKPVTVDPGSAAEFWPEGYVCTMFCLAVHAKALDEEFYTRREVNRMVDDIRA